MIKLYGLDVSGNTYKVKLLLNLLNIKYKFIKLDVNNKQHKSEAYLKLNPRGEFPALEDETVVIWDSQAILIYLAQKYASRLKDNHWYPNDATDMALITQWLTVANGEIFNFLGKARSRLKFGYECDLELAQTQGKLTLEWIERHLSNNDWLATNKPSIADIACYPYIALCEEGGISLDGYPAIHSWFQKIESLSGYITMQGIKHR
ncbi:MAG: glutathione S-transferase N-terminal domain-containing protein [Gammaproteobacteria bacterium]|nr:glutathione S-transferase N-terminal domain-containing protein [Gammaproteobacteria bacterium]